MTCQVQEVHLPATELSRLLRLGVPLIVCCLILTVADMTSGLILNHLDTMDGWSHYLGSPSVEDPTAEHLQMNYPNSVTKHSENASAVLVTTKKYCALP